MLKTKVFLLITFIIFGFFIFGNVKAGINDNVSGYAWSENIGWISFNCNNPELPTPHCTNDYGVNINSSTGIFSGYAWSENIGWIDFAPSSPYPASPNYSACLDLPGSGQTCDGVGDYKASGWARALAYNGGWSGWIKLRDTDYGVYWDPTDNQELKGWAWSDMVIGWISFNCKNQGVCGTSDYQVIAEVDNIPPEVTAFDIDPSSPDWVNKSNSDVDISWRVTDSGGSHLSHVEVWRQPDGGEWIKIGDDYPAPANSDSWACVDTNDCPTDSPPDNGTWWYGLHVLDKLGNMGTESTPIKVLVDRQEPTSEIQSPLAGAFKGSDFPVNVIDIDTGGSGLDPENCTPCKYSVYKCTSPVSCIATLTDEERICSGDTPDITVTGSNPNCPIEGENTCRVIVKSKDCAGNSNIISEEIGSLRNFSIDLTFPIVEKIYCNSDYTVPCSAAEQGIEKTFKALVSDNVELSNCKFFVRPSGGTWEELTSLNFEDTTCPESHTGKCYIVSKEHTFAASGNYEMYASCWDRAAHTTDGEIVTIVIAENHFPEITDGPNYTTSPCTSPTIQPDCNVNFTATIKDNDDDDLSYSWDFGDGTDPEPGNVTSPYPVDIAISHHYDTADTYTLTLTISDNRGGEVLGLKDVTVTVPNVVVDLCIGLDVDVSCVKSLSGIISLTGVDFKSTVSGTMTGTVNFHFDCTNNGSWEAKYDGIDLSTSDPDWVERTDYYGNPFPTKIISPDTFAIKDLCNYSEGTFSAKVFIERANPPNNTAEDTVSIEVTPNNPPSATNLSVVKGDYCFALSLPISFSWLFSDDPGDSQSAYQVQIDNDSDFSSVEIDSCLPPEPETCKPGNASQSYAPIEALSYNTPYYYWRVRVWDSYNTVSDCGFLDGWCYPIPASFSTPAHVYPEPDFSWAPSHPSLDELIQFTDQTPGATSWTWDFGDGTPFSSLPNPTHSYSSVGVYTVSLEACDDVGCCPAEDDVTISLPLPEWQEVSPF